MDSILLLHFQLNITIVHLRGPALLANSAAPAIRYGINFDNFTLLPLWPRFDLFLAVPRDGGKKN
jgi:hypothetical protein